MNVCKDTVLQPQERELEHKLQCYLKERTLGHPLHNTTGSSDEAKWSS